MKIVVLAAESASTWIIVNALRANYPDLRVCIEKPVSRFVLLRNRMRKLGLVNVIGQMLFMLCLPMLRQLSKRRIAQLTSSAGLSAAPPTDLVCTRFDSVNSEACREWLRSATPDAVVVNGTRILSRETLTACPAVFLNTHCGITPAYRGVHGGYWALAQGDPAHAGVTVHVVDAGIDTGDIAYQMAIKIDRQDNFLTYPVRQYVAAVPLMKAAIEDVRTGNLKTYKRDDLPSALWFHPTLCQYLLTRLRRGVR
jgi:phosphoribosylglycinamide formyltransferase-1